MQAFFLSALFDPHGDDDPDPDKFYENDDPHHDDGVTCDRCGDSGLWWGEVGPGIFRLFDSDGARHYCKPTADDFEDISQ